MIEYFNNDGLNQIDLDRFRFTNREPNNKPSNLNNNSLNKVEANCGAISSYHDGKWIDEDCNRKMLAVCECRGNECNRDVPPLMYYERIDNKGLNVTWFEARE